MLKLEAGSTIFGKRLIIETKDDGTILLHREQWVPKSFDSEFRDLWKQTLEQQAKECDDNGTCHAGWPGTAHGIKIFNCWDYTYTPMFYSMYGRDDDLPIKSHYTERQPVNDSTRVVSLKSK